MDYLIKVCVSLIDDFSTVCFVQFDLNVDLCVLFIASIVDNRFTIRTLSVILRYKYLRNTFLHFAGLMSCVCTPLCLMYVFKQEEVLFGSSQM